MNDLLNPYIAGAPVVEASMFFGREDVFSWIENSLTGKFVGHILVLHGQRRVGKTSVLKQIANFLPPNYIQVFFDLQGRTNTTLDRFLWWMASEIVRTLQKEHAITLTRPKRDAFADPDTFITGFIPTLQDALGERLLLLTFDEFDTLDRPDIQDSLARPLIAFLRDLFEIEGFNFIFSIGSSGNKLENMQAAYTDFFKSALYRKVSFLTWDDCHSLITRPVEGVITYEPEAIDQIVAKTSGHPYFTQLTCHELFARCQKTGSRTITTADVDEIIDDVIERGTVNLKFVWDEASDLEKWILAALAQEEGANLKALGKTLKAQGVRFSDADLNSAVLHLRDKDVLTRDNCFVIQLMQRWLETNRPMDRVREELVQTNPIADRYIEIGDEYRERQQIQQALDSYQQALDVQPNSLQALFNVASLHLQSGDNPLAAETFLKALQVDDEHIASRQGYCQAQLSLGDTARQAGSDHDATQAYLAILNVNPAHAQARQNLADIYRQQAEAHLTSGEDQQALERLRQAMEMTPEDDALAARHQQIIDEKKAALVSAWLEKADKALKRKRWDEAIKMADEALKVDPEDQKLAAQVAAIKDAPRQEKLKAFKGEAEAALARGSFDKSISALEQALALAPEDQPLADWLDSVRADQLQARLNDFDQQAQAAQASGNWQEALTAREAALALDPHNKGLIKALEDTKTAQHQARLADLRKRAQTARENERWDDARQALQDWLALSPDDPEAQEILVRIQEEQHQARLRDFDQQAQAAQASGDWQGALAARQAALDLDPKNKHLVKALDQTRDAWHQARLADLRSQAQSAREQGDWDQAIQAVTAFLELEPGDPDASAMLEEIRLAQHQARLDQLAQQAQEAAGQERWSDAVAAWEAYLAEAPGEAEQVQEKLDHAQKYARLSEDYQAAQDFMRKKQFHRAVPKLQGIIAQDPAYKSTLRLLTEAVEASRERQPIWKSFWMYGGAAGVIILSLSLIFNQRIRTFFSPQPTPIQVEEMDTLESVSTIPTITQTITEIPITAVEAEPISDQPAEPDWMTDIVEPILAYIADQPPDIENPLGERKLVLESRDENVHLHLTEIQSDSIAIKVDVSISESSPRGKCYIGAYGKLKENEQHDGSQDTLRNINVGLGLNEKEVASEAYNPVTDNWPPIASGKFEPHDTNRVTFIILQSRIAVFVDAELIYTAEDPYGSGIYTDLMLSAEGGAFCQFENIEIWNLEEIALALVSAWESATSSTDPAWVTDFAEPILNAIQEHEPYFYDNFGRGTVGWVLSWYDVNNPPRLEIVTGGLLVPENAGAQNTLLRRMPNYVLMFDVDRRYSSGTFGLKFGDDRLKSEIFVEPDNVLVIDRGETLANYDYSNDLFFQLILIIRNNRVGLYLDGNPIHYFESDSVSNIGDFTNFDFYCYKNTCIFGEVTFWNLDRFPELP